jgi:large subunit ribosomal protein L39
MRSPHEATQSGNGIQQKRSDMFNSEKQRQIDLIPRVEKIEVLYKGIPEDVTLYLNKGLSTPFNIAQRICKICF